MTPGEYSKMNKRLRLSMALALALCGSQASALGLGQIQVKSTLNQPLVAEIPVLTSNPGEADALRVRLAAPDAFARVGLDQIGLQAANLAFEVIKDGQGRSVIRVTTPNKVSDPFLSFLLEVDWGKGKMLREYTVLLDPPSMMPITRSAPATVAPLTESEPARAEPLLEAPPPMPEPGVAVEPAAAPAPAPTRAEELDDMSVRSTPAYEVASTPTPTAGVYGPVNAGETLWSIAQNHRPDESVTVNQMMLALLHANPEAFIDNNINRLRKGAVLRIPSRDEATVLAAADAAAQVREQMQTWSGQVASVLQPATAASGAPASTRPGSAATADSRLELTPPRGTGSASASTSGAAADGSGSELRAELARTKEEASALSQENVELKSRVSELEDLQSESRRLLELKDSELAAAQRRLKDAADAATQADATAQVDTALADAVADVAESVAAVDADGVADVDADAGEDFDAVVADAPFDETDADGLDVGQGVAEAPVSEPEPLVTEPATAPAPVTPAATADESDRSGSSFNPWLIGGGGAVLLGLIGLLLMRRKRGGDSRGNVAAGSSASVPAVTMPELSEKEGELIEALSQHPDDLYLHLELLSHYYTTQDAVGFEMAAEAMHAQVRDEQDPAWQEACSMGREIAPDHPLFAGMADDAPAAGEATDWAEADEQADVEAFADAWSEPETHAPAEDESWSTGSHETGETVAAAGDEDAAEDDHYFEPVAEAEAQDELDDSAFDTDVVSTKLELARAYLDMGDNEGARGMLEEVLSEGSEVQRDEARQLLDSIS